MDINAVLQAIDEKLVDPEFANALAQVLADYERCQARNTEEEQVRALAASRGYRIMHRRNGRYWVMIDRPMSLDDIASWIDEHDKEENRKM
jgi:hypothetical protein